MRHGRACSHAEWPPWAWAATGIESSAAVSARSEWAPEFAIFDLQSTDELFDADPDDYPDDVQNYLWTWTDKEQGVIRSRMFAANEDAGTATVTDLGSQRPIASMAVGIEPEGADALGTAFDVRVDGIDAIVLVPAHPTLVNDAIHKINVAGVPLINCINRLTEGDYVSYIGSDDYTLGLDVARYLYGHLNGRGKVVLVEGPPGSVTGEERSRAFVELRKAASTR